MSIPGSLNNDLFSKYIGSIQELYETDEDFRTLCDDYAASKMNMEKYNGRLKEDVQRKLEYENLTIELEKEIIRYVKK